VIGALLWDVDGTLAETERDGHLVAFNRAFEALGVPWRWGTARYGELLAVAGGYERLLHDMTQQPEAPAQPEERAKLARRVHKLKNELYGRIVAAGELPLRAGVAALQADCRAAGVALGIATTTSTANVAALLGRHLGRAWRTQFAAVVCAEQAPRKKPDPQVYEHALAALGLPAKQAVAIEDSPAGVAAAQAAGVAVIVTHSHYFPRLQANGVLAAGPSLGSAAGWTPGAGHAGRIDLAQIIRWRGPSPQGSR
jgi:HAD superfamily hydrolase (TIGR01509 family)